jgi:hypothetical protein
LLIIARQVTVGSQYVALRPSNQSAVGDCDKSGVVERTQVLAKTV